MAAMSIEAFAPQNQEISLPLPAAATQGANETQAGRDRSCRALRAFTERRKRGWMPVLAALLLSSTGAWAQGIFGPPHPVGIPSLAQSVTVTAQLAGKVKTVEILTMGAPGLDFAVGGGASTCPAANLAAVGQQCTESVTFTAAAPGLRMGAVVLLDQNGKLLGTTFLSGTGSGGLGALVSGNILPVAGNGFYKDAVADGLDATLAELYLPSGVTVDGAGNLYIADTFHHRIRMVCASATSATITGTACTGAGIITTIAGNGDTGYTGDGTAASGATLSSPAGVALDGAGNLYIADTANNAVRKITAATGIITTVAGTGVPGYTGDGGAATASGLNGPESTTIDAGGNIFIADTLDQRIRRVDAATGIITTVAGNGTAGFAGDTLLATNVNTELNYPDAVAFDALSNMYIADSLNNRVREVNGATGSITTFAGNGLVLGGDLGDGGLAIGAELDAPSGVAVDPAGNVYIADTQNNAIRMVTWGANPNLEIISTIAKGGVGEFYFGGAFGPVIIHGPTGLFLDSSANLYFADTLNMTVREIQSNFVAIDLTKTPIRQGSESATQNETVANVGNAPLNLTAPDIFVDTNDPAGVNATLDAATTTCPSSNPFLANEANCVIGAIYAPSLSLVFGSGISSEPLNAYIDVGQQGDTLNSPLDIELVGVATPLNSTTVALISSLNPSEFGKTVTFTATVTTGTGNLTGTVTFYDGAIVLQAKVALSAGAATYATSTLPVGSHPITATYNGDATHFTSTGTLTPPQVVNEATTTTLASAPASPSALGASVTFTATVTPGGGGVPLDGTVTFTNGAATLCNAVPLTLAGGVYSAVCSTTPATALAQGVNTIKAAYSGDVPNFILASSITLIQDVGSPSITVLTTSGSPSVFGSPVTFTAVVSGTGPAPTGNVSFTDSLNGGAAGPLACAPQPVAPTATCTTATLPVGTHTIIASYPGDSDYSASTSNTVTQVVNLAQTTTTVVAVPNPGIAGAPVAITATVLLAGGGPMTGGTVSFADTFNGATVTLGSPALSAAGTATVNPLLAAGTHSIVATYSGDADGATSVSAAYSLTVNQAVTQTTVTATPNPALVQATVTFTATVASVGGGIPGGTVTFNANGNPIGAAATLDPTGKATITSAALAAGTYTITAVYSGDTNDQASTGTGAPPLIVGKIPTVTDLGASTTAGSTPQVILVAATLDNAAGSSGSLPVPTGTITFNSGATTLGTATLDSSGVATLVPNLANGTTYNIVAVYGGDDLHSPSTSVAVSINGTASGFNLTVTPNAVTMAAGQNASVNVALASLNGFADTIGLGCASLPAGVNCQFSSPSSKLAANGVENVTLTIDTNNPLGGGTTAMNAHPGGRGVSLAGLLLPLSALFGFVFWRFRKRYAGWTTLGLVLLLGVAAQLVTGCSGSFSQSSAAAGTFVIQVTGTGATSDVSHYQNVTLTITGK